MSSLFAVRIEFNRLLRHLSFLQICYRYSVRIVKMEKTIRTILDQAQNNNIRHGEHLKALADFYAKVFIEKYLLCSFNCFSFFFRSSLVQSTIIS